ncbi:MAG: hypothetical protein VKL39_06415 [Leptolyngbyaceae bacterium]|nr:hypothetical protein [Leptolyngbyaceae bacterium]
MSEVVREVFPNGENAGMQVFYLLDTALPAHQLHAHKQEVTS